MILGLCTATSQGSVALVNGSWTAELDFDPRGDGAIVALQNLLTREGVAAAEIQAVAVSVGPGSFTGCRIGVAAAQGFCFAAGIPAVPVGTLDGLAGLARTSDWGVPGTFILASVDARRAEVYAALYGVPEAGGETELVWGPEVVSCVTLAERFARSRPEDRTVAQGVLVGDGAQLLGPLFPPDAGWESPERLRRTSALAVARCGEAAWRAGDVVPPDQLVPVYLRKSDAEINREKRLSEDPSG